MPAGTTDPEGDIVLVVGNDKVRIFASSCLLCIASKPFAKMLGPNFKEGQIDKASTRKEISLPDDKSSAMEILCNILHHRHPASFLPKATDVYDLAILADKYDCIRATALAAAAWIQPNPAHDARDLGLLLISASMYGLPEAFFKTSASLILGHRGTYNVLGDVPDFVERLGWETILQLEEKRNAVRVQIDKELLLSLNEVSCHWDCEWSAQQFRKGFKVLQESDLLVSGPSERLSDVISKAKCSAIVDASIPPSQCQSARWHRGLNSNMRKHSLERIIETSGISFNG